MSQYEIRDFVVFCDLCSAQTTTRTPMDGWGVKLNMRTGQHEDLCPRCTADMNKLNPGSVDVSRW